MSGHTPWGQIARPGVARPERPAAPPPLPPTSEGRVDRLRERHDPDERCHTNAHCWSCHVDELNEPGDYRVCGECGHIYRQGIDLLTADTELVEAINRTLPTDQRIAVQDDPDKVQTCPLCTHDF